MNSLSDHKPVTLHIRIPEKKRRPRRNPNINWEKLKDGKTAKSFKDKTQELSNNINTNSSWSDIARVINKAAIEVCGKKTRHITNPWTVGREDELAELHKAISQGVTSRNEALTQNLQENIIMRKKGDLKFARGNMKRRLRTSERLVG